MPSRRLRSLQHEAFQHGRPATGLGNYAIDDLRTVAGKMRLDVWSAFQTRVIGWRATITGNVSVSAPNAFNSTTTFSGFIDLFIPAGPGGSGDESDYAYGKEIYGIRTANSSGDGFSTSTTLTMVGDGAIQQPNAPTTLNDEPLSSNNDGITMSAMRSQAHVAQATFTFGANTASMEDSTAGPLVIYQVFWRLQASPFSQNTAPTVPIEVGAISVAIPDWLRGGTNIQPIPLYLDGVGDSILYCIGGGFDYGSFSADVSGSPSINISLVPILCHRYDQRNGVRTWNDDGSLAVSVENLIAGEP